jgi:hypothetical protein
MRILRGIMFVIFLVSIIFSCNKDEIDDTQNDNGILLEIEPNNISYIGENDNHYYSNAFIRNDDIHTYRLKVDSGIKYHIFCVQPDLEYSNIAIALLDSNRDTIMVSTHPINPKIVFESNTSNELFLSVYLKGPYINSLSYNVYFEKAESLPLDFLNYEWEYTGNWKIVNNETLKFTNIDARRFRWIRLDSSFDNHPNVSFKVTSLTNTVVPSFGFICGGSSRLQYGGDFLEELPDNGIFFNITDNKSYRILNIEGTGIGYDYGNLEIPNLNLLEGVKINLIYIVNGNYSHYSLSINDVFIQNIDSNIMNKFFLVIEDRGFNDIIFENLKIE